MINNDKQSRRAIPKTLKLFIISYYSRKDYFNTECDAIPQFNNSDLYATESVSRVDSKGKEVLVSGSRLTYKCHEYYVTDVNVVECGVDGKWAPKVHCYPS